MPIYEYECSKCGHHMEVIQKMSDEPLKECPECHERGLSKLISASGFQLKGSGWYVTDYSSRGKDREKDSVSTTDSKSETKSTDNKDSSTKDKSSTD